MQTQAETTPTVAAVVTHDVADYEAWKSAFEAHATARQKAGIVASHVNRHAADANRLSVYLAGNDGAALDAFLSSTDLMAKMRDAGVKGPPQIAKMTPVEDRSQKTGSLAGAIVRHEVRDYAAWKAAFDAHAEARAAAGIVGHAVNRSQLNPNVVIVYLQAPSIEALQAFMAAPDLKETMQSAGVVAPPDVTFVQGADWGA